jgi:hypothetical protein
VIDEGPGSTDFATELARCGPLPLELLDSHTDDGTGHCEVCPAGSDGSGRLRHPCNVHSVALAALMIQARRRAEADPTGQNVIWLERGDGPERRERPGQRP